MTQLNEIRIMNDTMIVYLKKIGINYQRNEIIKKIFSDDACFFKMDKGDAFLILSEIGIKDNIEETYDKLISNDVYYDLYKKGKIDKNDMDLVIKYEIYDTENLFKNKNTSQKDHYYINKDTSLVEVKEKNFLQRLFDKIKSLFIKR